MSAARSLPYASFTVGGHQYTAQVGDVLEIDYCGAGKKSQDYLSQPDTASTDVPTQTIIIKTIHAVCSQDGTVHIGQQALAGATLKLKVLEHTRNPKIIVFKKKRRKKYRKMSGHKQPITLVELTEINIDAAA